MVKYHIVIITSSMEENRKMNEEKISILIGRDYGKALQLGQKLASWGAFVSYTEDSVLHILNDFMRIRPHALILSSLTGKYDELCTLLKRSERPPYIVLICEDCNSTCRYEYADLILDPEDKSIIDKLRVHLFDPYRFTPQDKEKKPDDTVIAHVLFDLCVTKNYTGYIFILEAIKMALEKSTFTRCVSKEIYPAIAARFKVSPASVERNIRTAIQSAWNRTGTSVKREYFGTFAHDERWRPTNSQFIYIIADRLSTMA